MLVIMSLPDRVHTIDHDRPVWPQVAAAIENDIVTGEIRSRLPAEDELAIQYGVARNTVRRAIEHLRDNRHLVETFHGRGTYVRNDKGGSPPQPGG